MKPSGIGGMAVLEGVMMKNKDEYAIAVRKPDNEIAIQKMAYKDLSKRAKIFKLPVFRGMLAFIDSTVIGIKVLNYAASFFEEEETSKPDKKAKNSKGKSAKNNKSKKAADKKKAAAKKNKGKSESKKKEESNALLMIAAVVISVAFSILLFMVIPVLVSNLFSKLIDSTAWLSVIEALLRLSIFVGYILLISQMPDIKRVFMYHGAEHKTINCLENGFELTVENVRWQSKEHKRCGTSFMLIVMLISAVFFMVIRPETLALRVVSRILLVPIIAGLSYEFIRLAGKSNSKIVNILSRPGMWMQGLTTKEPDDSMIEVAIQSVEAVFDWRGFLEVASAVETEESEEQAVKSNVKKTKSNVSGIKKESNPSVTRRESKVDEEEDEILKALDRYIDFRDKNTQENDSDKEKFGT